MKRFKSQSKIDKFLDIFRSNSNKSIDLKSDGSF